MTLPTLESLFEACAALPEQRARLSFALANPRLLALASLQALEPRHGQTAVYQELAKLQGRLARHPEDYPLGNGPIEALLHSEQSIEDMVAVCRSDAFQARIAPLYLKLVGLQAMDLARGEDWQGPWLLSLLSTQAALAWEPTKPTHPLVVEVVQTHLQASIFACSHELDDGVFGWALAGATEMLTRLQAREERAALGLMHQGIGALFSDIWTVPGRPDDPSPTDGRAWARRAVVNPGLLGPVQDPPSIPPVADALRQAVACFESALPFRSGAQRGLTYKSIVQTLGFAKLVLGEDIDGPLLERCLTLAPELLTKHQEPSHAHTVASMARALGATPPPPVSVLAPHDQRLLDLVQAHAVPVPAHLPDAAQRREAHEAALRDLARALRHGLPWLLCLRNFDHADKYFRLGDDLVQTEGGTVRLTIPVIRYSLVDHKLLELFPECALGIVDPRQAADPRMTAIPMLSLGDGWASVVEALMAHATRTVILLDALSPGVQAELDLVVKLGAASRTLIVTGHAFRTHETSLPPALVARFPHIVDWVDFAFDEAYYSQRYKAHGLIADLLPNYVRGDARPTVKAWLAG
ncbi:MAG: hypothetical protein ACK5QH_12285 [Rubrivivax sp.]|jgi:hypothetical protein